MTRLLYCLLLTGSTAFAATPSAKYTQIINQVEYDENGNVSLDKLMTVDKTGTASSPDNVVTGSTFTLWCINNDNNHPTEIQVLNVDAYDPEAEITLLGILDLDVGDDGSRRTRADLPFTVQYKVDGLITNDPTVQQAARMVNLDTDVIILPPETLTIPDGSSVTNLHMFVDKNATDKLDDDNTGRNKIQAKDTGLITYTTSSLADGDIPGSILGSKVKVYIFPTPTGDIDLPDDLSTFRSIPDIPLTINNLYPDSVACLRVTRVSTGEFFDIDDYRRWNTKSYAQDETWTVDGEYLREHEAFTGADLDETFHLDLMSKTTFDEKSVANRGVLDPQETIHIRGLITSAE